MTIVNDETMKMTRELDTCLNLAKIFTHTPNKADIEKKEKRLQIPSLYLKIFERSLTAIKSSIQNYFSFYLESYEASEDKPYLLKQLFAALFSEANQNESDLNPWISKVSEDFLEMFYLFIWYKLGMPEIPNFGRDFFFEVTNDTKYQLHLLK